MSERTEDGIFIGKLNYLCGDGFHSKQNKRHMHISKFLLHKYFKIQYINEIGNFI